MPDSSGIEELPPLSDRDINILFQIVSDAQQSPNPPFRALFAAYDKVLAQHGIAQEHDGRFFRYLLRLGEGRAHNSRSLMSKLRKLLAKFDIHIVVQDDQDFEDDEGVDLSPADDRPVQELGTGSGRRSRRASFNDTGLDETWLSGGRLEPAQSGHNPRNSLDDLSRSQRPSINAPPVLNASSSRGRVPVQPQPHPRRSHSLSTQDSVKASRPPPSEPWARPQPPLDYQNGATDDDTESDFPSSPPVLPPNYQPPVQEYLEEELEDEADSFLYMSQVKTARRCLHRLHHESSRNRHLAIVARNHDERLLKAQAFSIWAAKLSEIRQAAETEQFFEQYEKRATRARDLFLLNKAFTHWAQSTSDEIARTSVARRHILRTRYFNAWRDITAVNDLKCRRLGLRKWFLVWRTNAARKAIDNERAVAIYEENLVRKTWWKWFWAFCERKAPIWREHRLKQSCFHRLAGAVGRLRQHHASAEHTRDATLLRKTFGTMVARRNAIQSMNQIAEERHQANVVGNCFHHLVKESKLGHASKEIATVVSRRLLTTAVSVWHTNAQLSQQATAADRQRILRNVWRNWNDNLRARALASKIDDRVVLENLYKWVLHSRLALFRRVMDNRLQERALQTLSLRLSEQRFHLEEAAMIFHEHKRRRMMASVMLRFHGISRADEMMERQALEFRNTRVMNAVLPYWVHRTQHLMKLNRWSNDARFYCLASSTLKKWKEATAEAQRNKRRDAYVEMRSRIKLRMARNSLAAWRERTNIVKQLDEVAIDRANNRHINAGTAIFNLWRDRTQQNNQLTIQAEEFSARVIFLRTVATLVSKGQEVLLHHAQALTLRSQTIDLLATETLKKLKWALFCHRRSLDSAAALEQRNAQQHRRNMLRYWAEQASRRRAARTLPLPLDPQQDDLPASPTRARSPATAPAPTPAPVPLVPSSNLFSSLRLPSARKTPAPAPLSAQSRLAPLLDDDEESDVEEMDFGATHRAEEWTSFDVLRDVMNRPAPSFQPAPQQSFFQQQNGNGKQPAQRFDSVLASTPVPGYMARTPSKRQRAKALSSIPPSTQGVKREVVVSTTPAPAIKTTPAPMRNNNVQTPQVTPFERKMRKGGYGSSLGSAGGGVGLAEESFTPATFRRTRFGGAPGLGLNGSAAQQTGRSVRFFDVGGAKEEVDGKDGA
ncbi:Sfi1-domain-containing protein [Aureobasidium pullulans]|uniref:Sfi1-domain-containing protein n=1 Tax=Aureobasidium pullulans TaxID=5580 RepID=A0AB74JUH6_AURPU|nr:Sfi1-domain-containing protein [Aureobasidium pullulans]THX37970.1 Sfi1-domain-containing protein [Aureobasidium pullulans]